MRKLIEDVREALRMGDPGAADAIDQLEVGARSLAREAQGLQEDADASRERNARQRMGYPYGYPSGKIADSPAQLGSGPGHQEPPAIAQWHPHGSVLPMGSCSSST